MAGGLRILILNHNLPERGTYFRARRVAEGLHARGHRVTFVCSGTGWYRPRTIERRRRWEEWHSPSWAPFHLEEGASPLGLLLRAARLRGPWDLVYTFSHFAVDQGTARLLRGSCGFWMTDWCDLWSSRAGGLHDWRLWARPLPPILSGWRGALTRLQFRLEDGLEKSAPCQADGVSIIARPMRAYTRRLGVADDRVLHMVSGADTQAIRPQDRHQCQQELQLTGRDPVATYVANVTPDNRQLEHALALLWEEFPNLRVLSVGPSWFHETGVLARAIRNGHLLDFGRQPFSRIPVFLGAANVLLMPIRNLPFNRCRWPNKFGDYMASGRPTATSPVGDMGWTVERHGVGAIGAEPTGEGLAEAAAQLLRDPARADAAGQAARTAAETTFSWERQLEALVAFLQRHGVDG